MIDIIFRRSEDDSSFAAKMISRLDLIVESINDCHKENKCVAIFYEPSDKFFVLLEPNCLDWTSIMDYANDLLVIYLYLDNKLVSSLEIECSMIKAVMTSDDVDEMYRLRNV